ncbi:MAG: DUF368 domain-containing protein [Fervidobacterium sp.]|uniref:DUF368 domain-containing protein n=1 Tax=Fervidobacterium sp. TaxID=1871331 RepID=UPI004049552A
MLLDFFRTLIAGLLMGWANVIPGVSGGTIAVITGVFERLIEVVNDVMKLKISKKDLVFISLIALGLLIGILSGSKILSWSFENYPFYTYSFFYGLILFSLINFKDEISTFKIFEFLFGVLIVIIPYVASNLMKTQGTQVSGSVNYFGLFVSGVIAGGSMILPGLSGSLMLMILGFYEKTISTVSRFASRDFTGSNVLFIIVLGVGVLFGIGLISKLLKIWFEKAKQSILNFILGLVAGSLYPITPAFHGTGTMLGMFLWIALGGLVVYSLGKIQN